MAKRSYSLAIFFLLTLQLVTIPLHAEEYVEGLDHWPVLTLQRALELGLGRNLNLKIETLNVPIGGTYIISEDAQFDPEVDASVSAQNTKTPTGAPVSIDNFTLQASYDEAFLERAYKSEAGLSKKFQMGLDGRLSFRSSIDSNDSVVEGLDPQYRNYLILNLTQPLLKGFGTEVNTTNLRVAKTSQQQAVFGVLAYAQRLAAKIETTYYDMAQAIQVYGYRIESRDLALQLLNGNRQKLESGLIPISEVQEAETAVASRDEQVLAARQQLETVGNRLKDLIEINRNDPMSREFFRTEPLPKTNNTFPQMDQALPLALINRPELEQQRLEITGQNIRLEFSKNQLLPKLDLESTIGINGLSGEEQNLEFTSGTDRSNPQAGNYWDSLDGTGEREGYEWYAGIRLTYPLGNREAKARHRAANLEKKQAIYGLKRLETTVETEIINGLITAGRSLERVKVAGRFEVLAETTLDQEMERMQEGFSDTFRILDFQDKVIDSKIRKLTALSDFNKGLADLYLAMGTNLERLSIEYKVEDLEADDATN